MDGSEAREHLELVDRIIAASSRRLEVGGEFFVAWGVAGAILDVIFTLVMTGRVPVQYEWAAAAVLVLAVAYTVVRAEHYKKCDDAKSLLQRDYLHILWIAVGLAVFTNVLGSSLVGGNGQLAIWNIVESIVLLYIGVQGNRAARVCAAILLVSIAVANFAPAYAGYVLAAGVVCGYGGFGVASLLSRE